MKNKSNKNNSINFNAFIFFFWIICSLFLGIGYAYYTSTLKIGGKLAIVPYLGDIRITNVTLSGTTNSGVSNSINFNDNNVSTNIKTTKYNSTITYNITVTNETPYNGYITSADFINNSITGTRVTHSFTNMTLNSTVLPPRSNYTFTLTFKTDMSWFDTFGRNVSDADGLLNSTYHFEFSINKQSDFTLNATPSDSNIVFKENGVIIASGTGSLSKQYIVSRSIEWEVTKDGYHPKTGKHTYGSVDTEIDVILESLGNYNITIVPSPSSALVTIKQNDVVLATGFGSQTALAPDLTTITYEISASGYKTRNGTYDVNGKNETLNLSLQSADETPYQYVNVQNTSSTTATVGSFITPKAGVYLIEAWGGHGGNGYTLTNNGSSGYVYGTILLNQGETLYYTIGGNGGNGNNSTSSSASGGANGGGLGNGAANSDYNGGGGGGYSAVSYTTANITNDTVAQGKVLLIAAGGGGGSGPGGFMGLTGTSGVGGAGGTLTSTATSITGATIFHGADGTINYGSTGQGSGGGSTPSSVANTTFLKGANGSARGGGGGSGYNGGTGGSGTGSIMGDDYGPGGGGGGSSLVSTLMNYNSMSTVANNNLIKTNPSSTGGTVIITWISTY